MYGEYKIRHVMATKRNFTLDILIEVLFMQFYSSWNNKKVPSLMQKGFPLCFIKYL